MPEKAKTLENTKRLKRAKTPDRGEAPAAQASPAPAPDCMIVDRWVPPPSQGISAKERRAASALCGRNMERTADSDHSPCESSCMKKVLVAMRNGSGDGSWERTSDAENFDEEVTPSPNIRKIFMRLRERRLMTPEGGVSAISGPANQLKDGTASKYHRTT